MDECQTVSPNSAALGWSPEQNEMTLLIAPAGVQPKVTGHFSFGLAVNGIETIEGEQARYVLDAMSGIVQRILLATEAECCRLNVI